jgi:hypothetical protein
MAVSMSIASSVSASSRSIRTCLICSSNSTSDSWVTCFGGLDGPRGCLIAPIRLSLPGSRHRLAPRLAHQSSMRAGADKVVLGGRTRSPRCDLYAICLAAEDTHRTVTVSCGHLRTIAVAGGRCVSSGRYLHGSDACCTVVGGAARVAEGAGLNTQGRRRDIEDHFRAEAVRTIPGFHPRSSWRAPGIQPYAAGIELGHFEEPADGPVRASGGACNQVGSCAPGALHRKENHHGRAAVPVSLAVCAR